jgi:hypothetical protein
VPRTRACNAFGGGRRCNESPCWWREGALKALPTKHWPPLRWFEWHRRLDAAHRAAGSRLRARRTSLGPGTSRLENDASPSEPAPLTTLRGVSELFVEEKELFPDGEDKFTATICAD